MRVSTIVFWLLLVSGCKSSTTDSQTTEIIGSDDRSTLIDNSAFKDSIGRYKGSTGWCTGFAIDKNVIVSAAHCFTDHKQKLEGSEFEFANGKKTHFSEILSFSRQRDYVALRIKAEDAVPISIQKPNLGAIHMIAYDPKQARFMESDCNLLKFADPSSGALLHDCDSVGGTSGGVILQNQAAIGIHLGFVKEADSNLALDLSKRDDKNINLAKSFKKFSKETDWSDCDRKTCSEICEDCFKVPCVRGTCKHCEVNAVCETNCKFDNNDELKSLCEEARASGATPGDGPVPQTTAEVIMAHLKAILEAQRKERFYQIDGRPEVYFRFQDNVYCRVQNPDQLIAYKVSAPFNIRSKQIRGSGGADCGWPSGFYGQQKPGVFRIYGGVNFAIGTKICHVKNPDQLGRLSGGAFQMVSDSSNLYVGMTNTGDCEG